MPASAVETIDPHQDRAFPKHDVVGVGVSEVDYEGIVAICREWVAQRRARLVRAARYVCVTSVHGIVRARQDADLRRALNRAEIATPDGMPVVWALRSFGVARQKRVYGPTLMLRLCEDARANKHRIFLYGSTPRCLDRLCLKLKNRFDGIEIAGAYSPPFRPLTPEEDEAEIRMIRESGADIVFVGISTPKQEKWMYGRLEALPGVVMFGVGAAFDFHAGLVSQAPPWMQRNGLEWFYRLCMEPKRLWKRYLIETPRFLPLWAMQRLRLGRPPRAPAFDWSRRPQTPEPPPAHLSSFLRSKLRPTGLRSNEACHPRRSGE